MLTRLLETERFRRGSSFLKPKPTKIIIPNPTPGSSQTNPGRPNPSTLMTHKEDKGEAPKIQRSPISEVTCSTQSLSIGELEVEIYETEPNLVDEYVEEESQPELIEDYDNMDVYEVEVNLLDEYIGELEKNDSEPIEPLVECIEEIYQAKDSLGTEKEIESSD